MKRFAFIFAVLIAAFAATAPFASAQFATTAQPSGNELNGELQTRQKIFDRVKLLVEARDFAALDALELDYRTTRARTPSGVWKLDLFHGAVHAALGVPKPEQGCALGVEPVLKAWTAVSPEAPSPYIATATMLLDRASCFRGDSYARDVPDAAWEPFHDNVQAAEQLLLTHKHIVSKDPQYYLLLEDIYRAEGRSRADFQKLLDEATAREPYYYGLYWHAYSYNMPQWSGGIAEIEQAARYAVGRTRHQDGLSAYARYYWSASEQGCDCWMEAIDWPTMKQAMADAAERYPDAWNLAHFALFACMFNDREAARTHLKTLVTADRQGLWANDEKLNQCRAFAGL